MKITKLTTLVLALALPLASCSQLGGEELFAASVDNKGTPQTAAPAPVEPAAPAPEEPAPVEPVPAEPQKLVLSNLRCGTTAASVLDADGEWSNEIPSSAANNIWYAFDANMDITSAQLSMTLPNVFRSPKTFTDIKKSDNTYYFLSTSYPGPRVGEWSVSITGKSPNAENSSVVKATMTIK